jgi:SAM-dependent methyltransferase
MLDIGCGNGVIWKRLLEHGDVEGIEPDGQLIPADSPWRPKIEIAPFPGRPRIERYDLILMLDVLEHIEDDRDALRALARRMDVGAHLVVTVPALQWAFSSWDTELGHFRRYSRQSLSGVVTEAGFAVVRCDYLFPELLPLLTARKLRRAVRAHADFPQLSPAVAQLGYRVSSATASLRRLWPAGTSLLLVARRDPGG